MFCIYKKKRKITSWLHKNQMKSVYGNDQSVNGNNHKVKHEKGAAQGNKNIYLRWARIT